MTPYTLEQIRDLVTSALSDEELTTFCHDHFPAVYQDFTTDMTRQKKIELLLDYAERHGQLETLLRLIQKINPYRYNKFVSSNVEYLTSLEACQSGIMMSLVDISIQGNFLGADISRAANAAIRAFEEELGVAGQALINVRQGRLGSMDLLVTMPVATAARLLDLYESFAESDYKIERVNIIRVWVEPLKEFIFSLPEFLQPAALLPEVERSLSNRSRQVVNRYKSISERGNWQVLEEAEDEANKLWVKYGDPLGHATVFLWLADLYWRSGELGGVLQHCKKALDLAPGTPASVQVFLTKAVAYYMLGLAHQMQGNLVAMLEALQEASSLFESSQNYRKRSGNYSLASIGTEIEKWIKTLIAYANELRQNPSTESETKVIYPLRASTGDKYALAELIPTATVNGYEAEEAQSDFMLQRSQARLSFESIRQIGYQVKPNLRVFDASSAFSAYMLQALNPYARLGNDLILPAGGFYYMLPIDDQLANAKRSIRRGDYLLACDVNPIIPGLWRLVQLKGESVIYGLFERDEAGQIKILPASIRSIGESQTKLDLIGQADFILRPT